VPTHEERSLGGRAGAHESWARTADRTARTEPGRRTFMESFERQVDPDRVMDPVERARRAEHLRKAHFARMALRSAQVRRARGTTRNRYSPPKATTDARDVPDIGGQS
jgi:hypothetical protein